MSRLLTLAYGVLSYAMFFLTFLYAIGFIGNVIVPKSLDSGATDPWTTALAIDLGLLSLFAVQHSVMARQGFKRLLTRVIPAAAERSTYVLASSVALLLLFWQWRPLGGIVWNIDHEVGRALLYGAFGFGWLLVLYATFVINHFDLFGLRQSWRGFRGQPQAELQFVTPVLYRIVRHPLYLGWLLTFWSTPTMTVTHAAVRRGDHGVHLLRDSARRTRSPARTSGVRGVSPASAHDRAGARIVDRPSSIVVVVASPSQTMDDRRSR